MREQGVAANATPRRVRGRNNGKTPDPIFRAKQRCASTVARQRVTEIARELARTGSFSDPARAKLLEGRKAVVQGWLDAANTLDAQGESTLAGKVRHFVRHLPRVLTAREQLALGLVTHLRQRPPSEIAREDARDTSRDFTADVPGSGVRGIF
jgi:type IV secretion system T-DNA border endonuclease VirD2